MPSCHLCEWPYRLNINSRNMDDNPSPTITRFVVTWLPSLRRPPQPWCWMVIPIMYSPSEIRLCVASSLSCPRPTIPLVSPSSATTMSRPPMTRVLVLVTTNAMVNHLHPLRLHSLRPAPRRPGVPPHSPSLLPLPLPLPLPRPQGRASPAQGRATCPATSTTPPPPPLLALRVLAVT